MTVAEKIFALWGADATAISLVPASRFKYAGSWQNVTVPYVIFEPVTQQRYRTLAEGAASSIETGTWQFSIFAASSSAADIIRERLITVLDGNKGGFNFHFQASRFVDETPDRSMVLVAVDFFVSSVPS